MNIRTIAALAGALSAQTFNEGALPGSFRPDTTTLVSTEPKLSLKEVSAEVIAAISRIQPASIDPNAKLSALISSAQDMQENRFRSLQGALDELDSVICNAVNFPSDKVANSNVATTVAGIRGSVHPMQTNESKELDKYVKAYDEALSTTAGLTDKQRVEALRTLQKSIHSLTGSLGVMPGQVTQERMKELIPLLEQCTSDLSVITNEKKPDSASIEKVRIRMIGLLSYIYPDLIQGERRTTILTMDSGASRAFIIKLTHDTDDLRKLLGMSEREKKQQAPPTANAQ